MAIQRSIRSLWVSCLLTPALVAAISSAGRAEETVSLRLSDGRVVAGSLSALTDDRRIAIFARSQNMLLQSRFEWSAVDAITVNGRPAGREEIRKLVASASKPTTTRTAPKLIAVAPLAAGPPSLPADPRPIEAAHRVRSLRIEAVVDQWDADAAADGLRIRLFPVSAEGRLVPVRGEVSFTLVGTVFGRYRRDSRYLLAERLELERKSFVVSPDDFNGGAEFLLPFDRTQADRDPLIEPYAVLHARLGIPQQGVFEASTPVWLRPWDPLVDRLPYFFNPLFSPTPGVLEPFSIK